MFSDIVETFNLALGSKKGTIKLVSSLGPKNHLEYKSDNIHLDLPTIDVKITTLDDLVESNRAIKAIDFIKVDIEGAEYDFLCGAQRTIDLFKPIILMEIEEHRLVRYNTTAGEIFDFMAKLGYKYLLVTESTVCEGVDYQKDLKKGRDFIFYRSNHSPVY